MFFKLRRIKKIDKLLFLFIFLFFYLLFSLNGVIGVKYNSSYSNTTIYLGNWCANMLVPIRVYDSTDFAEKENIKDNLCGVNDTLEKDHCRKFIKISGKLLIHNGPLESQKIIFEQNLNENSTVKFNFPKPNNYLIEFFVSNKNYNDDKKIAKIYNCHLNSKTYFKPSVKVLTKKNKIFSYLNNLVQINLTNTSLNKDDIIVSKVSLDSNKLLYIPKNTILILNISSKKDDFQNIEFKINFNKNLNLKDLKVKYYDFDFDRWEVFNKFTNLNNFILIRNQNFGFYSFILKNEDFKKDDKINLSSKNSSQLNLSKNSNLNSQIVKKNFKSKLNETKIIANSKEKITDLSKKDSNKNYLIYFFIFLGLIVFSILFYIFYLYFLNKEKNKINLVSNKNNLVNNNNKNQKIINISSYNLVYKNSKEYVLKYKDLYQRVLLENSLRDSKVPEDIIKKVFNEIYK